MLGRKRSLSLSGTLLKTAPFVLGAAAAAVWLTRRSTERPALPERAGIEPPRVPTAVPPLPPLWHEAARPERVRRHANGRFARRPIDIVTVVDDLLSAVR
jgi:hypothetical protein